MPHNPLGSIRLARGSMVYWTTDFDWARLSVIRPGVRGLPEPVFAQGGR
jgi:hypothetical protein